MVRNFFFLFDNNKINTIVVSRTLSSVYLMTDLIQVFFTCIFFAILFPSAYLFTLYRSGRCDNGPVFFSYLDSLFAIPTGTSRFLSFHTLPQPGS